MIELSPSERRALKARAHHLHPLVMVGESGLTPAVLREIDNALKTHDLIKIRVLGDDREARGTILDTICQSLEAGPVQTIGKILVVYRPLPEKPPSPAKPRSRAKGKKQPRRTKRSYQND